MKKYFPGINSIDIELFFKYFSKLLPDFYFLSQQYNHLDIFQYEHPPFVIYFFLIFY